MSHFTVLVIGEDVENQLAPFNECPENNSPYLVRNYVTEVVKKEWEEYGKNYSIEVFAEDEGYKRDGDQFYRLYNPNAKWDWWLIGGRWTGFFKLKNGSTGIVGEPGILTTPAKEGWVDSTKKKNIDILGMKLDARIKAEKNYTQFEAATKDLPIPPPWKTVREAFEDIDIARNLFNNHVWTRAIRKLEGSPFLSDLHEYYCIDAGGKEAFIKKAENSCLQTFAVLKDGEWYEQGSMGWWGIVSDEDDNWNEKFIELFDSLSDDTQLTIVDCHI